MRKLSILALLVLIPATARAQGGGGGARKSPGFGKGLESQGADGADRLVNRMKDAPSMSKDLQKANPIEFLLDQKKDLHLSEAEQKELKTIASSVKDLTKPYFKTLDSIQREQKKTGEAAPTTGQMFFLRQATRESQDSVRVVYERSVQDALTKLTEEHRKPATDALQKEMEEQMAARHEARGGRPPA